MGEREAESMTIPLTRIKTEYAKKDEVIYTPTGWPRALPADIFCPTGSGPWPAVLLIYGGNWSPSDHRWQMSHIAQKLARRGYAVMNVTYRGAPDFIIRHKLKICGKLYGGRGLMPQITT
jgi:acetyl esterase/lipase